MGVYKRGDSKYWWIDYIYMGKRIRESTNTVSKTKAQKILDIKRGDIARGRYKLAPDKRKRFSEIVPEFLEWGRIHKSPRSTDRFRVKPLLEFWGNTRLADITAKQVESYIKTRPVANATINKEIQTLKRILNLAIEWHYLSENPLKRLRGLPEPPKTHRWIKPEEIQALTNICRNHCQLKHLRYIILIAVLTGMRKSELLNLKWEHVDLDLRRITVKHTKHYRNRYIPMSEQVYRLFADQIPKYGEYVFSKRNGAKYTRCDRSLASAVRLAGVPKCTLHDFRATWATEMLSSGVDVETVRTYGGWKDLHTLLRYVEVIPHRGVEAMESLSGKYA